MLRARERERRGQDHTGQAEIVCGNVLGCGDEEG